MVLFCFISCLLDGVGGSVCLEAIKVLPPASHSHRSIGACPLPLPRAPTSRDCPPQSVFIRWESNCSGTNIIRAFTSLLHQLVKKRAPLVPSLTKLCGRNQCSGTSAAKDFLWQSPKRNTNRKLELWFCAFFQVQSCDYLKCSVFLN